MAAQPAGDGPDWSRRLDPRPQLRPSALAARLHRLRSRMFLILQCGIGGSIAWSLARYGLGHRQPFFAPITVIVGLGLTYGHRLRRVVEVTFGVAIGVLVGDVLVHLIGTGPLQVVLVTLLAMSLAVLAGAGGIIMIQAGVQSMIVVTLVAPPGYAFSRWLDAVCGGLVAVIAATITPASPIRRPRQQAARVLRELDEVLGLTATSVRRRDQTMVDEALRRARASESLLSELREATDEGIAVIRQSPFRRRHAPGVVAIAEVLEPLDRAIRNIRVLVRRAAVAVSLQEPIPPTLVALLDDLASACRQMAEELDQRHRPVAARPLLIKTVRSTLISHPPVSLSAEVVRAQVRSVVVDLLMLSGMSYAEARAQVPTRPQDLDVSTD